MIPPEFKPGDLVRLMGFDNVLGLAHDGDSVTVGRANTSVIVDAKHACMVLATVPGQLRNTLLLAPRGFGWVNDDWLVPFDEGGPL